MAVNLEDKKLKDIEAESLAKQEEIGNYYDQEIKDTQSYYDDRIAASRDWEQQQIGLQNDRLNLTLEEINNQKAEAQKDYVKEQSGAYTDWQKQSNRYGANAEQRAALGMSNTGYSESSQVAMYNTYQNRTALAREVFERSDAAYNIEMDRARAQNDVLLAEIAYNGLQERLQLGLEAMQYKNALISEKTSAQRNVANDYYTRWLDMLEMLDSGVIAKSNVGTGYTSGNDVKNAISKINGVRLKDLWDHSKTSLNALYPEPTLDEDSIADLGRGDLTAEELNKLVEDGEVKEILDTETGKIKFVNVERASFYLPIDKAYSTVSEPLNKAYSTVSESLNKANSNVKSKIIRGIGNLLMKNSEKTNTKKG